MKRIDTEGLLKKYQAGECTDEEKLLIEHSYVNNKKSIYPELSEEDLVLSKPKVISRHKIISAARSAQFKTWHKYSIAASLAIIMGITAMLLIKRPVIENDLSNIKPGKNQATLILPNGKEIKLNDVKNGELAIDQGVRIIKQADGQLLYLFNSPSAASTARRDSMPTSVAVNEIPSNPLKGLNKLTTPRGGQYHIALPDGTNVWVNAGSTLCFPSSFEDLPERRVLLIGEAYFEVAQVKTLFGMKKRARKVPFIVKTASQEVMVLGTHFNINAYPDEKETKTTLLEGSVGITAPLLQAEQTILEPGDQGINNGSVINVKKVDTDLAVAWKNGKFMFRNEPLENLMRKIGRWYNLEITYENKELRELAFGGAISKYENISKVLQVLEATGDVHFKIKGRRVTVTK